MRIALLEDDPEQAHYMRVWFEAAGHACVHFTLGEKFLRAGVTDSFDLLVLDWLLPDINGDEVLVKLRAQFDWHIPVLFVTGRDSERDIVYALEHGADDYMIKPAKPLEMLARITALSRRAGMQSAKNEVFEVGAYRVDSVHHAISRAGEPLELTHKEFDLAALLLKNVGRLISRKHIMASIWGQRSDLNTRTVDTHMSRIRNKLGLMPSNGWRLSAVYQHGYRLERIEETAEKQAG